MLVLFKCDTAIMTINCRLYDFRMVLALLSDYLPGRPGAEISMQHSRENCIVMANIVEKINFGLDLF